MKTLNIISRTFIIFSALSLFYVSAMAFVSPQMVMDLVHVKLENTDALSSIRGVYGGVGLTIVITLIYLAFKNVEKALTFLFLLWGLYAISRVVTILVDGRLGDFGTQWLTIETVFAAIAITLLLAVRRKIAYLNS